MSIDQKISEASSRVKDTYLESLQATLEMCDIVLQNKAAFPADQIAKTKKLKKETLENIKKRESILEK